MRKLISQEWLRLDVFFYVRIVFLTINSVKTQSERNMPNATLLDPFLCPSLAVQCCCRAECSWTTDVSHPVNTTFLIHAYLLRFIVCTRRIFDQLPSVFWGLSRSQWAYKVFYNYPHLRNKFYRLVLQGMNPEIEPAGVNINQPAISGPLFCRTLIDIK
ncbi:hypothetical protein NP493_591g02069 [Ridgeia piscesae]|uniref:Uncharacterized protein n=1 Tax=Ridgeia piscesae TaxID=27915 RepID=A0AAD9KUG4_RIDPI|nr:hypothetical protein NP493_591g02069 [Ridgeia piscesae]